MIRMTRVTVTAKAPPPSRIAVGQGLPDKCDRIPVRRPAITPTSRARMIRRALTLRLLTISTPRLRGAEIVKDETPGSAPRLDPALSGSVSRVRTFHPSRWSSAHRARFTREALTATRFRLGELPLHCGRDLVQRIRLGARCTDLRFGDRPTAGTACCPGGFTWFGNVWPEPEHAATPKYDTAPGPHAGRPRRLMLLLAAAGRWLLDSLPSIGQVQVPPDEEVAEQPSVPAGLWISLQFRPNSRVRSYTGKSARSGVYNPLFV